MSFLDKLFPRKGQEEIDKEDVPAKKEGTEAGKEAEQEKKEKKAEAKGEEDFLDMKNLDLKHPLKSFREYMKLVREGVYKGDKRAWHQFLMVAMISFAGICIIMTLCINFCMELVNLRGQLNDEHTAKVVQQTKDVLYTQESLPSGEYGIVHIFQSDSFHMGEGEDSNKTVVMVANCKGGPVLVAALPQGTEMPSEWFGADSYNLVVDRDGKWTFQQTESFAKHKETVEKARQEFLERTKKEGNNPQPEAANP